MKDRHGHEAKNWGANYRNWELSSEWDYYTCTEQGHPEFIFGAKYVVVCHGHGNFEVLGYEP